MASCVILKSANLLKSSAVQKSIITFRKRNYCCRRSPSCDMCKCGYMQSPVEICLQDTELAKMPPLRFANHFDSRMENYMSKVYDTVQITVRDDYPSVLEGGPLCGSFIFDHLHFYWGENNCEGTNHSIDKNKFAMEATLVYFNRIYGCAPYALNQPDGLAMLSILMESTSDETPEFNSIVNCLPVISNNPGVCFQLSQNMLKIFQKVLDSQEYVTYQGSLIKKPCCEDVVWLVFKNLLSINCNLIENFRNMLGEDGKPICSNIRSLQSLNGRNIYCALSENQCPDAIVRSKNASNNFNICGPDEY